MWEVPLDTPFRYSYGHDDDGGDNDNEENDDDDDLEDSSPGPSL